MSNKCSICSKEFKEAMWHDAIKRDNECHRVTMIVPYNEKDDTFDIDCLIEREKNKIDETEDLVLFSFNPGAFTRQDIIDMNFGEEAVGPTCLNCKSYI